MDEDERGDTPGDMEGGEARAGRIPILGCLVFAALVALVVFGLYRFAIWQGISGSISF